MQKHLVIQGARFGDLLQTSRLIKTLHNIGETTLIIDKNLEDLANIIYPDIKTCGFMFHGSMNKETLNFNRKKIFKLKNSNFNKIYNCNLSPLTNAVARLFNSKNIIGYRPAHNSKGGSLFSPWLRLIFRLASKRNTNPLNLVDIWGWFVNSPIPFQAVNPLANSKSKILGIAISGRREERSLSINSLANIIKIYDKILNPPLIKLFGTEQEGVKAKKLMRELTPALLNKTNNLCGKTDWKNLVQEMKELGLLITPDTGLMHMAAFLGIPVMAFFLSSALGHETGPYGEGHLIWQALPSCAPCIEKSDCTQNYKCSKIFESQEFYKVFSAYLMNKTLPDIKSNFQLWKTGFDELGQCLNLLIGEDIYNEQRNIIREYLKEYLDLKYNFIANSQLKKKLLESLIPDTEWMLEPWRYSA